MLLSIIWPWSGDHNLTVKIKRILGIIKHIKTDSNVNSPFPTAEPTKKKSVSQGKSRSAFSFIFFSNSQPIHYITIYCKETLSDWPCDLERPYQFVMHSRPFENIFKVLWHVIFHLNTNKKSIFFSRRCFRFIVFYLKLSQGRLD